MSMGVLEWWRRQNCGFEIMRSQDLQTNLQVKRVSVLSLERMFMARVGWSWWNLQRARLGLPLTSFMSFLADDRRHSCYCFRGFSDGFVSSVLEILNRAFTSWIEEIKK